MRAWELARNGSPHNVLADGRLMESGEIIRELTVGDMWRIGVLLRLEDVVAWHRENRARMFNP